MWHPSARPDGRGHLSSGSGEPIRAGAPRWLLVGNSRWHWAEASGDALRIWHEQAPPEDQMPLQPAPAAWAAVGRLPPTMAAELPGRVVTADVPLQAMPAWLGVDRALAGWLAWRLCRGAVLVADAGTVLSLTRVDRQGRFAGGRLMAGLGLQLRAMSEATAALPPPPNPDALARMQGVEPWPKATGAAMAIGVTEALAAALAEALRQVHREDPRCSLVLTGGDGPGLWPVLAGLLGPQAEALQLQPDLALRALADLRPGPVQVSPRSAST